MTKVSMRHLNEIVRERNQYSRDALEAWQDFINLKGRMDMELTKVTKRNNFLVEELESWKQQVIVSSPWTVLTSTKSFHSFSNFKRLLNNSQKKHKISRSRSKLISAKIAVSPFSSINRKTMLRDSPYVFQGPRSNETMLSKRWYCSRRLQKSSNAKENATRRSYPHYNTQMRQSLDKETRPKKWFYTFEVLSVVRLIIWSTSFDH